MNRRADRATTEPIMSAGDQVTFSMSGKNKSHRSYSAAACFSQSTDSFSRKFGPAKSAP